MVNGKDYFVVLHPVSPRRYPNNPTAKGVIRYDGEYRVLAHPGRPPTSTARRFASGSTIPRT